MPTPDIIKVFREKFGTGYVDPLNHSVREIVRDEHEKFLLQALSAREKEIVAGIEKELDRNSMHRGSTTYFSREVIENILAKITKGEI